MDRHRSFRVETDSLPPSSMDLGRSSSSMRARPTSHSQDMGMKPRKEKSRTSDSMPEKERESLGSLRETGDAAAPVSPPPVVTRTEFFVLGILTLIALVVRFYHIERPSSVVYVLSLIHI